MSSTTVRPSEKYDAGLLLDGPNTLGEFHLLIRHRLQSAGSESLEPLVVIGRWLLAADGSWAKLANESQCLTEATRAKLPRLVSLADFECALQAEPVWEFRPWIPNSVFVCEGRGADGRGCDFKWRLDTAHLAAHLNSAFGQEHLCLACGERARPRSGQSAA